MPRGHRTTARSTLLVLLAGLLAGTANAATPKQIVFPVVGPVSYTDDFGDRRGGRSHQGNDIMAGWKQPVVAVEAGRVEQPSWSSSDCALILHGRSGTDYWYLHLNNDRTRRDDDDGGCRNRVSYARDFRSGMRVRAGQLIGYVGNSGNAAGGATHLHFELHPEGGRAVSPYRWLKTAPRLLYAVAGNRPQVRLAFYGSLTGIAETLGVAPTRVAVSRGWRGRSALKRVSLRYAPGFVVERKSEPGALTLAALRSAQVGERVTVWTAWFAPNLASQLGGASALAAERLRLRGES